MNRLSILQLSDKDVDNAIKISGTQYDRRRKLNDKQLAKARKLFNRGYSLEYIASRFGVRTCTIRYHVDDEYRRYRMEHANYGRSTACSAIEYQEKLKERADYKRKLVARGRVTV